MTTLTLPHVDPTAQFPNPLTFSNLSALDAQNRQKATTFDPRPRHRLDIYRAFTPPEMSNVQAYPSFPSSQEHDLRLGDNVRPHAPSRTSGTCSSKREAYHQSRRTRQSHQTSPMLQPTTTTNKSNEASSTPFQIPKSINSSGGGLSELAAQITCLFWFESIDVLHYVEDSVIAPFPQRLLVSEAKPTASFRKFVNSVLTTTCVAQNVVLLALLFIYRLKQQNQNVRAKPGSEYRLLTVALMLGNKFLDDNTYTNKTWAEVSGIDVSEVHIMEVEFLSNMKYCLFTSEQDWQDWQSLLARFAIFYERSYRPQTLSQLAPLLPAASSLRLPKPLPSPPSSNQASPPYVSNDSSTVQGPGLAGSLGPTPIPSPSAVPNDSGASLGQPYPRKRSFDDHSAEPSAKRISTGYSSYRSPQRFPHMPVQPGSIQPVPRMALPNLLTQQPQNYPGHGPRQQTIQNQLPPLTVPSRTMGMVYPNASTQAFTSSVTSVAGGASSHPIQTPLSHVQSRHQSPYGHSATPSPSVAMPPSASGFHTSTQISPSFFLQQRSSPYRPVHQVSTLLFPPPSGSTQSRIGNVELNQMQYRPLGQPVQHSGRLPYLAQNQWLVGNETHEMTPVHQWPGFANIHFSHSSTPY